MEIKHIESSQIPENLVLEAKKSGVSLAKTANFSYFGAYENDKLIGFCGLGLFKHGKYGLLKSAFVLPEYREKDVYRLLNTARLEYGKSKGITEYITSDYHNAAEFHIKNGAKVVAEYRNNSQNTAVVTTPKGDIKFIPDAYNYQGYLVSGSGKRCYFNRLALQEKGLLEKAEKAKLSSISQVIGTEFEYALFRWGANPHGYLVESQADRQAKQQQAEETAFRQNPQVTLGSGFFGLTIKERLPKEFWAIVKPFASYRDGGEQDQEWADDMGFYNATKRDLQGWYYQHEVVEALSKAGVKVLYGGFEVKGSADLQTVNQKLQEIAEAKEAERKAEKQKIQGLKDRLNQYEKQAEYVSKEEAEEVSKLPKLLFPELGFKGANIYGGGSWLHLTAETLYFVRNNGMDGDDWRLNNYPTGGAGAVCNKIAMTEDLEKLIEEIKEL